MVFWSHNDGVLRCTISCIRLIQRSHNVLTPSISRVEATSDCQTRYTLFIFFERTTCDQEQAALCVTHTGRIATGQALASHSAHYLYLLLFFSSALGSMARFGFHNCSLPEVVALCVAYTARGSPGRCCCCDCCCWVGGGGLMLKV